jgi:NADH-quinone oxidoreductase subunit E/NADP-reducing hydrogenase subunit HndA
MSSIKIELRREDVSKIQEICAAFKNDPQELINVLHSCQEHFGYLPAEIQEVVSSEMSSVRGMGLSPSIHFYYPERQASDQHLYGNRMLRQRRGKVLGNLKRPDFQVGQTSPDGKFSLSNLRCVAHGLAQLSLSMTKLGRVAPDEVGNICRVRDVSYD